MKRFRLFLLTFITFFFAMTTILFIQLINIKSIASKLGIMEKSDAFQGMFLATQAPFLLGCAILFSSILFVLFLLFVVSDNKSFSVSFIDKLKELDTINAGDQTYEQAIDVYKSIITDPETGAVIYKHFRTILDKEFIRSSRYHLPFALMRIAVQNKKDFEVLQKKTSSNIHTVLRNVDVISINNEKEFICLLPNTKKASANLAVARIFKRLQSVQEVSGEKICIAVGLSSFPEDGADVETLLSTLDKNFQKARMMGENKVIF